MPNWSSSSQPPRITITPTRGGTLDHGLEIVAYALKLRQSCLLPTGTTPEDQVVQAEAWTAAVAQALGGGDPARAMSAPTHTLQRKLLDGLRYLLKEELKLNQPQASDGWLTQDTLWLVSKTVSDKLRARLLAQGIDGIPSSNTVIFKVLQDHGMLQPTPDGKAIWRATVTSDTGWSHAFTLLRLVPALIWDADDRPAPFAGTVVVNQDPNDAPAAAPTDTSSTQPGISHTPPVPSAAPDADSVDALLALLGTTDIEPPPHYLEIEQSSATNATEQPAGSSQSNATLPLPVLTLPPLRAAETRKNHHQANT